MEDGPKKSFIRGGTSIFQMKAPRQAWIVFCEWAQADATLNSPLEVNCHLKQSGSFEFILIGSGTSWAMIARGRECCRRARFQPKSWQYCRIDVCSNWRAYGSSGPQGAQLSSRKDMRVPLPIRQTMPRTRIFSWQVWSAYLDSEC